MKTNRIRHVLAACLLAALLPLTNAAAQDGLISVTLSASPNPVPEGSPVTVTAHLSGGIVLGSLTIPLELEAGSAEEGDYGSLSSITIDRGGRSGTGTLTTNQDDDTEHEVFIVSVARDGLPSVLKAGSPSHVAVTIVDDEGGDLPPPSVSFSVVSPNPVPEGETVSVQVGLSRPLPSNVTIPVTVTPGTAESGDYSTEQSTDFTITAGWWALAKVLVRTNQDDDTDDETFTVALDTANLPAEVRAGSPSLVRVTISDDDGGGGNDGDGDDGDDDSSEPANRPPTVTLSCEPCKVEMEGEVILTASASDPDDDPLTYTWSASAGVIVEAADPAMARWTAPATIETVTIRVEVSDGEGGTAEAQVSVDVLLVVPEQMSFDIPNRGAATSSTGGEASSPRTGYGRIRPDGGMAAPSGIALFQFRDPEGVLITETSVPAAHPIRQGRIFAEVGGAVVTAVAFANPNDRPSEISFYVTDTAGKRVKEGRFTLEAKRHLAGLLTAAPFEVDSVVGTFTFTASARVAVIALRGATNKAGEWVATALPVGPVVAGRVVVPSGLAGLHAALGLIEAVVRGAFG